MSPGGLQRRLARGLLGLSLLSAVVTLLPLAARHWWIGDLFAHFHLQYAGGQLLLAFGLLCLGRYLWCLSLLPLLAFNLGVIWPYLLPTQPSFASDAQLKLMSVNIARSNHSFDGLLTMIAEESPDLILVLEYTPGAAASLQALSGYPHRVELPVAGAFGIALFSRLTLPRAEVFALGATAAIDAEVAGTSGVFRVLGAHLLPPMSEAAALQRNLQLELLAEVNAGSSLPTLIMGDFNISPYSPFFSAWLARTRLRDSLAGQGLTFTWPTYFPLLGITIDHCAVSEEFTVLARRHLADIGSDHRPIFVELTQRRST